MCLACEFTERTRVRVAMFLMFLSIAGTTFSKFLILTGYNLMFHLQKYLNVVETYDAGLLPLLVMFAGLFGLVVNAFGIYLYFRSLYPQQRSQLSIQLSWHHSGCGVFCVLAVCMALVCALHSMRLDTSFRGGIQPAMKEYRTNVDVKSRIDDLQRIYKCCGSEDYTDWFRVVWIPNAFIDANEPEVRLRLKNGIYESDDVPYSCCDPMAPRPCINFQVHDNAKHFNYFHSKDLTIYQDGCREVLKNLFFSSIILPVLTTSFTLFCLVLLVLLMGRYLHTSIVAALETGIPTAESRGHASQCCIFVAEEVIDIVMKRERHVPSNENLRPSVPAMCGKPPQPWISSSATE